MEYMKIYEKKKEILNIIKKSSQIFIVAHRNMDLDAINSCIALSYYLKKNNEYVFKHMLDLSEKQ